MSHGPVLESELEEVPELPVLLHSGPGKPSTCGRCGGALRLLSKMGKRSIYRCEDGHRTVYRHCDEGF